MPRASAGLEAWLKGAPRPFELAGVPRKTRRLELCAVSAGEIARALNARATGDGWLARCPAHDDRTPSLSISESGDGRVLVHCHAGCGQAKVISALRDYGLWPSASVGMTHRASTDADPDIVAAEQRRQLAMDIWRAARPASGTPVETYLEARGVRVAPPAALRFHPNLRHRQGGAWPAMVALVTDGESANPVGVHRTFLRPDGGGKALVSPAKMMLGPCRGGVVRLAPVASRLMVGEGIETCLAVAAATGHPVWAALSTAGLASLSLPSMVAEVIVLADGDDPGEAAAQKAASRWARQGRTVRIARAPKGHDFNDVICGALRPESEERDER